MVDVQKFPLSPSGLHFHSTKNLAVFDGQRSPASNKLIGFSKSDVTERALPDTVTIATELEEPRVDSLVQIGKHLWFTDKSLKRPRSTSLLKQGREKRLKQDSSPPLALQQKSCPKTSTFTWSILPAQTVSFLDLPPEIRHRIYRLLFARPSIRPISQVPRYFESETPSLCPRLAPFLPFLRTNSQIHREASRVLYGDNTFNIYGFDNGLLALDFVRAIGDQNRRSIRCLDFDWHFGFSQIPKSQQSDFLFAKINDESNPLHEDLAKATHACLRENCQRYADTISLFRQPAGGPLRQLTVNFPSQDANAHPQNFCHKVGCSGCDKIIKEVLWDVKGLDTLTVGELPWKSEVETMARIMGVGLVNVTNIECLELTEATKQELKEQGWQAQVMWKNSEDEDEYRKMLTKIL